MQRQKQTDMKIRQTPDLFQSVGAKIRCFYFLEKKKAGGTAGMISIFKKKEKKSEPLMESALQSKLMKRKKQFPAGGLLTVHLQQEPLLMKTESL